MSSLRATKSGDQIAVQKRLAERYSSSESYKLLNYIKVLLDDEFEFEHQDEKVQLKDFHLALGDARALVRLVNKAYGKNIKVQEPASNAGRESYKVRERIGVLLESMKNDAKLNPIDLFDPEFLTEGTNLPTVLDSVRSYCIAIQHLGVGPENYWPVKATKNVRKFSKETLDQGKKTIGLQMGTNEMASNTEAFGNRRDIT